jgi:hypothetical protein
MGTYHPNIQPQMAMGSNGYRTVFTDANPNAGHMLTWHRSYRYAEDREQ